MYVCSESGLTARRHGGGSVHAVTAGSELRAYLAGHLLSKRAIQLSLFMAVGMMRVYPALNAAGVDLPTALVVAFVRFPVAILVLGALSVWPATYIGCRIKQSLGLGLSRYFRQIVYSVCIVLFGTYVTMPLGLFLQYYAAQLVQCVGGAVVCSSWPPPRF